MARAGPRKVARYGGQFKATAGKLSSLPGVLIQDVAAALDIHPFMQRLARAHANCIESFPIIGGLLVVALLTNRADVTDALAPWLLLARLLQSSIHVIST